MAEMRRVKRLDLRTKTYVLLDGRDYPRKDTEFNPNRTSTNICDISYNVRKTVESLFDEMDDQVVEIKEWLDDDDDFDFFDEEEEDTDIEEKPKKVRFLGRKPPKTKRPFKNFLRTFFHIKSIKSDAELQQEEEAIRKLVEMNPDRPITIYSMGTLLAYLVSHPGVTASPCQIIKHLNLDSIRAMHGTYMHAKDVLNRTLEESGLYSRGVLNDLCRMVEKINSTLRDDQETFQALDRNIVEQGNIVTKRKMVLPTISFANKSFNRLYEKFGMAYWEFKLHNDDSFNGLYDFLALMVSDFCKLNPIRPPDAE